MTCRFWELSSNWYNISLKGVSYSFYLCEDTPNGAGGYMSEDQCSELSGEHQQMQTGQLLVFSLNLQPYIILLSR